MVTAPSLALALAFEISAMHIREMERVLEFFYISYYGVGFFPLHFYFLFTEYAVR